MHPARSAQNTGLFPNEYSQETYTINSARDTGVERKIPDLLPHLDTALKKVFAIVILSAILSACTTVSTPVMAPFPGGATAALSNPVQSSENLMASAEDPLPSMVLTPEIFYKLTTSEIAFQRGEWQGAYITLLNLAQQTRDARIAHRAAEMALSARQGAEALLAVRLWRELAPHSEEANHYYLSFLVVNDKMVEAQLVFAEQLSQASVQNRAALIFRTQRMLALAKDKAAAFAMLENLLGPYGTTLEAHLALAQSALGNGDNTRALMEGRAALKQQPDSELAALTVAQAATDPDTAVKQLALFLSAYPTARQVRIAYARILSEQKKFAQARAEFELLLKAQPDDLNVLYALGILSAQSDDMKGAEAYFSNYLKQLEAHPGEGLGPIQVLWLLAQIAEDRGDIETALQLLAKVDLSEQKNPLYFGTQIKRAQLIGKRGDLVAARKLLQEVDPQDQRQQVQIILADAQLLRDAGQLAEASGRLELGLKRFPDETDLLYDYAMTVEKLNRLDVMESALRKVIVLAPENQHAYNALGYSLADRGLRLEEAQTLIEKALKLAPEDPFILDSMAWVQFRLNRLAEAEMLLRRTYAMRPDPEIAVHLGEVLWAKGNESEARKIWREAEVKDPTNIVLKNTLARLKVTFK